MTKKIKLTKDQVLHIATLAKLKLNPQEVELFQKQLSQTLDYIKILEKLDTANVFPTSQVTGLENVLREDKIKPSLSQDEALSGTKNKKDGYFKTKAIFGK